VTNLKNKPYNETNGSEISSIPDAMKFMTENNIRGYKAEVSTWARGPDAAGGTS
jgi:hypothetical protein